MKSLNTVDEYIESFPNEIKDILNKIRKTVMNSEKNIQEGIYYGMPGYKLNGPLVYFAAFKNHIGLYPTPAGAEEFKKELSEYKTGKGSVQFPLDKQIPYDLIKRIVQFRVKENLKK